MITYNNKNKKGFTLILAVIVASIVLAIGIAIVNITLKQYILSDISENSEVAFGAASAGAECIKYWDRSDANGNTFDVPGGTVPQSAAVQINCFGLNETNSNGPVASGGEQSFEFDLTSDEQCIRVKIWKYFDPSSDEDVIIEGADTGRNCNAGTECTYIKARGYNKSCTNLNHPRVVERAINFTY